VGRISQLEVIYDQIGTTQFGGNGPGLTIGYLNVLFLSFDSATVFERSMVALHGPLV
jgi:hypothetical protein